jgi:hypothetical protein
MVLPSTSVMPPVPACRSVVVAVIVSPPVCVTLPAVPVAVVSDVAVTLSSTRLPPVVRLVAPPVLPT